MSVQGEFNSVLGKFARESYSGESITSVLDRLDRRLVDVVREHAPSTFKEDKFLSDLSVARMPQRWTRELEAADQDSLDTEQSNAWLAVKEYESSLGLLESYSRQENSVASRATGVAASNVAQARRNIAVVGRTRGDVPHAEVPYIRVGKWPQSLAKIISEVAGAVRA